MAFYWTGVNELKIALAKNANLEAAKLIVQKNGAQLQQKAQRNTPVDTGNLRRSEMLELEDNGLTARVAAHANYAPYVEYGTRFMDGRHYMKAAFDAQAPIFKSDMDRLAR